LVDAPSPAEANRLDHKRLCLGWVDLEPLTTDSYRCEVLFEGLLNSRSDGATGKPPKAMKDQFIEVPTLQRTETVQRIASNADLKRALLGEGPN